MKQAKNLINDFTIINQGSIVQFLPLTDIAKNWCEKHIPTAMRMGFTYCVEHRYAIDIVEGIKQE